MEFHGSVVFSLSQECQGRFLNKIIFKFNHKATQPCANIDVLNVAYSLATT